MGGLGKMEDQLQVHPTSQLLRQAREERGLSLADVHQATKVAVKYLAAIEAGEFDRCPHPVYARAFVKLYALYLGLEVAAVLQEYDRWQSGGPQEIARPPAEGGQDAPLWRRLIGWANL